MRLTFADGAVQRLCATQESLILAFGQLWISVKICLSALAAAETLADVAAFAAITVRSVCRRRYSRVPDRPRLDPVAGTRLRR